MLIALDLEKTLIVSCKNPLPRPGLCAFLEGCKNLGEIVIFTVVSEEKFRQVAAALVKKNAVPTWFERLEIVKWPRRGHKDLRYIYDDLDKLQNVFLVDDNILSIHPGFKKHWIEIAPFEGLRGNCGEFKRVLNELKKYA